MPVVLVVERALLTASLMPPLVKVAPDTVSIITILLAMMPSVMVSNAISILSGVSSDSKSEMSVMMPSVTVTATTIAPFRPMPSPTKMPFRFGSISPLDSDDALLKKRCEHAANVSTSAAIYNFFIIVSFLE